MRECAKCFTCRCEQASLKKAIEKDSRQRGINQSTTIRQPYYISSFVTSILIMRRQTLAATDNSAIPAPATAGRSRQSIAPTASSKHARASTIHGSQSQGHGSNAASGSTYNAPHTVARTGHTYGSGNVALGWSAARGDAGNLRSSYAPTTRWVALVGCR